MIRVQSKPEYLAFDGQVRQPGAAFLATCANPTSEQFKKKNFWGRAARELHAAYSGICAYTAMYLTDWGSVDHFLPKALFPHLAYEWTNYRLANARINSSKGNLTTIIDPFLVEDGWFHIEIPACLLKPNRDLDIDLRNQISNTINSLRLNQDDHYVQERCNILMDYARGDVSLNFLERRYPFLAKEIERQGLDSGTLRAKFKI